MEKEAKDHKESQEHSILMYKWEKYTWRSWRKEPTSVHTFAGGWARHPKKKLIFEPSKGVRIKWKRSFSLIDKAPN